MGIPEMIAAVMVVTQFLKKLVKFLTGTEAKGKLAVILSVISSFGVVCYSFISTGTPFTISAVLILIQVIVASNAGYSLIEVARKE